MRLDKLRPGALRLFSRLAKTAVFAFAVICLASCPLELTDDSSITVNSITIYNIPEEIHTWVMNYEIFQGILPKVNKTFKVYLSASDYMDADKPHKAQASALVSEGTFNAASKTYSVTMELRAPIPGHKGDPDKNAGPWSGTANYFLVVLSPQDVSVDKERAIYVKASDKTLNIDMKNCNWAGDLNVDFNKAIESGIDPMKLRGKALLLFEDIVCKDNAIKTE